MHFDLVAITFLLVLFTFVCGMFSEYKDHIRDIHQYVLEKYGDDLGAVETEYRRADRYPGWIGAVLKWYHPGNLQSSLRMLSARVGAGCAMAMVIVGCRWGTKPLLTSGDADELVAMRLAEQFAEAAPTAITQRTGRMGIAA